MNRIKVFYKKTYKIILVVVIAVVAMATVTDEDNKYFEISKNLEIYANLYKEINTQYVDETDPANLMRIGIDAMLASLDPYTNYISEAEIEGYRIATTGKYGGVGASIQKHGDKTVISDVVEGLSAAKAGLKVGDIVKEVDGKSAEGKETSEIGEILKGSPGTKVKLMIDRIQSDGALEEMIFEIDREKIVIPNVPYSGMVNDEIGYFTLTTFTQQAGANVANALNDLRKNPKLKAIIFDLRGNGGGLLNEAVNVSNVFINNDELVVTTRGKVKEWDRNFKTRNQPVDLDIPLVILTDKGSASASEIVAGVIQDLDRGVILGQKSYGKGLVQNTLDVGYNSRVKVTIAKYYIPSGRCIQAVSYKNGVPIEIPDSEKAKFKTRNGREVLDGGGIYPDVKIAKEAPANVTISLMENNLIFDYATLYTMKNETIKSAKQYAITDVDYEDFVKFVQSKNHTYETSSEKMLQDLEKKAKEENYLGAIEADLKAMRTKIEEDKAQDIYKYKAQIKNLLEREIVSRYYYEKGKIELGLQNDEEIKEAIKVLNDEILYKKLLARE
ncbi:MAG: carboxyl-terminal processing protease [Saprospiraceae bacterium]|jgi:carboxyl-terminal processing protease